VLGLVFSGIIGALWREPLSSFFQGIINLLMTPLRMIF